MFDLILGEHATHSVFIKENIVNFITDISQCPHYRYKLEMDPYFEPGIELPDFIKLYDESITNSTLNDNTGVFTTQVSEGSQSTCYGLVRYGKAASSIWSNEIPSNGLYTCDKANFGPDPPSGTDHEC